MLPAPQFRISNKCLSRGGEYNLEILHMGTVSPPKDCYYVRKLGPLFNAFKARLDASFGESFFKEELFVQDERKVYL